MYVTDRQLFLLPLAMLALCAGCGSDEYASLPVSTLEETPFAYEGRLGRIWGGDNFEVIRDGELHYLFIRGIDTPEAGQPFHEESKELLAKICEGRIVAPSVLRRDEWKREVCDVIIKDTQDSTDPQKFDIALLLVQKGLAWHDRNEEPWSARYREAELLARYRRIGIWSEENPVAPWDFWNQQQQQLQEQTQTTQR